MSMNYLTDYHRDVAHNYLRDIRTQLEKTKVVGEAMVDDFKDELESATASRYIFNSTKVGYVYY